MYGRVTVEEHERRMLHVLERLHEQGGESTISFLQIPDLSISTTSHYGWHLSNAGVVIEHTTDKPFVYEYCGSGPESDLEAIRKYAKELYDNPKSAPERREPKPENPIPLTATPPPAGAEVWVNGSWWKRGVHNKFFRWSRDWVLSPGIKTEDIKDMIRYDKSACAANPIRSAREVYA